MTFYWQILINHELGDINLTIKIIINDTLRSCQYQCNQSSLVLIWFWWIVVRNDYFSSAINLQHCGGADIPSWMTEWHLSYKVNAIASADSATQRTKVWRFLSYAGIFRETKRFQTRLNWVWGRFIPIKRRYRSSTIQVLWILRLVHR